MSPCIPRALGRSQRTFATTAPSQPLHVLNSSQGTQQLGTALTPALPGKTWASQDPSPHLLPRPRWASPHLLSLTHAHKLIPTSEPPSLLFPPCLGLGISTPVASLSRGLP